MPKEPVQNAAEVVKDTALPLTLEEFCSRLSTTDRRVELIGGFAFTEKAAGRTKDFEAGYRQRFAAFINQPA